jgi:hypothetical protein
MSQTDMVVDEAIAKLDAEEAGTSTDEKETTTEDVTADPSTADNADESEDDAAATETEEVADDTAEEGEFTADDALEEEATETDTQPVTPTDAAGIQLTPAEQKYIADNIEQIGEPVTFTGKVGDKEVSYKVYDVNQLPRDFQPDSIVGFNQGVDRLRAMNQKAENLLQTYRQEQNQNNAKQYEANENRMIQEDLADLQKAGEFPKFKVKPGTPGFEDDPAAKQMGEVLDLMNERNAKYLEDFQKGRAYRHIGFTEAFELYQAKQGNKKVNDAQDAEDKARRGNARTVAPTNTPTTPTVPKPLVKMGTTIDQILAAHEND